MLHLLMGYNRVKEFFGKMGQREEKGQTLVEYALILGLIVIVVIIAVTAIGNASNTKFLVVNNALK
jgi:pilus assembly protein Flp/PilA